MRRRRLVLVILFAACLCLACAFFIWRDSVLSNFHTVVEARAYRSALPDKDRLEKWVNRYGIKTIINLRGSSPNAPGREEELYPPEVGRVDISFSALVLPSALQMRQLVEAIENSPRPVLIHCFSGIDRTGMASVIAAMALGEQDYDVARRQMSWRYLHFWSDPTHIEGVFELYEQWCRTNGVSTGGWESFRRWVTDVYHPHYYNVEITCPDEVLAQADGLAQVEVRIANRSNMTIPASRKEFNLAAFVGSSQQDTPEVELMARQRLGPDDIRPGESVLMNCVVKAPLGWRKGTIHFDLVEERITWFARQGSAVGSCKLIVGE